MDETGIRLRIDMHDPAVPTHKTPTFYGILLGHQNRQSVVEPQVLGAEWVMVRERMRLDLYSEPAEQIEEALRVADRCHRMHPVPGKAAGLGRGTAEQRPYFRLVQKTKF